MKNFKFRKHAIAICISVMMILIFAVPAFAGGAGGGITPPDTGELKKSIQDALHVLITLVGAAFTFMGAVQLIQSQASNDENQKASGGKQLGVGIALIIVGNGLVAGFVSMIP